MKTLIRLKSNSHQRRRNIVIEEINILRNFEGSQLIQNKITRELSKLHVLWFKGSRRGWPHEPDSIQYGKFLDELGWEFCAEGHRRQDMIRFGIFSRKSRLSYQASPDSSQDYSLNYS